MAGRLRGERQGGGPPAPPDEPRMLALVLDRRWGAGAKPLPPAA
jgi:hypothetical protein